MSTLNLATSTILIPRPEYFTKLAEDYERNTGNSTRLLFEKSLPSIQPPITSTSIVHDNAAGPGTASVVLYATLNLPATLEITDNNAAMIEVAMKVVANGALVTKVRAQVMSAMELDFPSNHFTHSIMNFSVFALGDSNTALQEVYRTLQPGGVAVLTTWKRFAVINIIHAVQQKVRPELPLMPLPGPQYREKGVLGADCVKAGFEASNINLAETEATLTGEDLESVRAFLKGPFTASARSRWTKEEEGTWNDEVDQAIAAEVYDFGGMRMEGWTVFAKK